MSAAVPAVTRAAVAAGHWAAGRRRRALAARAGAAGSGLIVWGFGTEAPTRAEVEENIQQNRDRLRQLGKLARRPRRPPGRQHSRPAIDRGSPGTMLLSRSGMVIRVRRGLRYPRRLTVGAVADEAWDFVWYVLRAARAARAARAVQRRRPRTAAGSALAAAGSLARLRAASAEPLQ